MSIKCHTIIKMEDLISVIFITRNRKKELKRAIQSCCMQNYSNLEIIVIDNASDENIENEISLVMADFSYCSYKYIYLNSNLGVACGRNYGAKIASSNYCFFLDDDAVIESKDFFTNAIADFKKNNQIYAIACNIYQPHDGSYLNGTFIGNSKDRVMTYVGAAHFIDLNKWPKKQLYPDGFMFGSEEMYSGLYIYKCGGIIYYDSELKVNHLPSKTNRVRGKERKTDFILNTYIARTHFYPPVARVVLFEMFVLHLVKNKIFCFKKIYGLYKERFDKANDNKMSYIVFKKYKGETTFRQRY